jgi:hypothetical protein
MFVEFLARLNLNYMPCLSIGPKSFLAGQNSVVENINSSKVIFGLIQNNLLPVQKMCDVFWIVKFLATLEK